MPYRLRYAARPVRIFAVLISNSNIMVYLPVQGDNPQALLSGLSAVQVNKL